MTGQRWLVGQVVPVFFGGFANGVFGPKVVSKTFFDRQGSRNIRKYFPQNAKIVSVCYVCRDAGTMLRI